MRISILFFFLMAVGCKESQKQPQEKPLAESRHSESFNRAVDSSLIAYDELADAFVRWDSAAIPVLATKLSESVGKIDTIREGETDRLKETRQQLSVIEGNAGLEEKRYALNSLTEHLFQYLRSVQYDRRELFLQECPMAFHDTVSGIWISGADSIKNPYLGLHHPKYGKGMLRCGENKDRINFTGNEIKEGEKE